MSNVSVSAAHSTITALRAAIADRDATIAALNEEIQGLRDDLYARDVDDLTGLHNRRWLREFWYGLPTPAATVGAVAFIDVDHLKPINDRYGHKTGDRVITHVAATLIASGCYAIRYGGDEFVLLVPAGWDIPRTIETIIDRIGGSAVPAPDGEITVGVSCGVRIVSPSDEMDIHDLIHDADHVMYGVKRERSGGYRVAV